MGSVANWQEPARIVHHLHANGYVTHAGAIVDERMAFALGVPGIDVGDAGFEFEGGGDTVVGLEFVVAGFLPVLVQVNEAGSNDESVSVDGLPALERGACDGDNFSLEDADVADGVETGFGIHDMAAGDYNIEVISLGSRRKLGAQREACEQSRQAQCKNSVSHSGK